jgi:hypothetical protein
MYRTHATLLKYWLPLLLIVSLGLALWQIAIPWYVLVALIPLAMVVVVLLVGKLALAKETRHVEQAANWGTSSRALSASSKGGPQGDGVIVTAPPPVEGTERSAGRQ